MMIVDITPQHTFFLPLGEPGDPDFEMLLLIPALPPEVSPTDPSYQQFLADFQCVRCEAAKHLEFQEIRVEHAQVHYLFPALKPFADAMLREQKIRIALYNPQIGIPAGNVPAAQVKVYSA